MVELYNALKKSARKKEAHEGLVRFFGMGI